MIDGVMSGWRILPDRGSLRGMTISPNPYRGFRFPPEVIQHAIWLYHCFSLSLRDVELILAARGIVVSYESIREWGLRFGRMFANMLKRRRPQPGDKWYMDEVFIRIRGKQHYLWRAVDQDGNVLDIVVQNRRSATAHQHLESGYFKDSAGPPAGLLCQVSMRLYNEARDEAWWQIIVYIAKAQRVLAGGAADTLADRRSTARAARSRIISVCGAGRDGRRQIECAGLARACP